MEEVKLYDIRKRDYPKERGDVFRSLQVFICPICQAKTNRVVMGGVFPMCGVRIVCPNSSECWHHDVEDKFNLARQPHPQFYLEEIHKEIKSIISQQYIKNDIEGNPDFSLQEIVTNVRSRKINSDCKHW